MPPPIWRASLRSLAPFLTQHRSYPESFRKDTLQQSCGVPKIWNYDICPNAHQSPVFPLIESARAIVGLVAGHSHGQAADFFRVLDFHVTVAKRKQLLALDPVLAKDALDDHFLGEL